MDRVRLKQYLNAAGVPEDRYLLVGLDPPRAVREGACILRPNQRSWEVLVWEPARLAPSLTFLSEGQACDYVLDALTPAASAPVVEAVGASPEELGAHAGLAPAALTTVAGWAAAGGKTPVQL